MSVVAEPCSPVLSMNLVLAGVLGFFVGELLFNIPECTAFSWGPSFHVGCTGITFGSTFRFPTVPLSEGIRHIHTLEHLENITVPAPAAVPYFSIQRVAQPQRYGDHVSVCVNCKVKGYPQTVYMLARPEAPESSTFMCLQDGTQRAMIQLRVSKIPYECSGHRLTMNCTYFTGPRLFDRDMEPVLRFLRFFEKRMRWHHGPPDASTARANLLWYRRMVLGLRHEGGGGEN